MRKFNAAARLAYYYFDFSNHEAQNLNTLLRCLLWQLCKHGLTVPSAAWTLYEAHDSGRKHASDDTLADALFEILRSELESPSYVIVDALDECPADSRDDFFNLILDRIERHGGQNRTYNFLFTSRNEPDIEARMGESIAAIHNVPIPAECVNADVRLHVTRFIADNRAMKSFPGHLKTEIEDTLSVKAQGMYVLP